MVGFGTSFPLRARNISCILLDCSGFIQPFSAILLRRVSYHPLIRPSQEG
ncbi:hypothetical protein Godav_022431 [Gossypium davidsonii]|uniref:Uncharacterized protein n=1 Tax=Gossypium davidsonii TaxID=34287 RepID=A0A7J8SNG8_GOSDV|nr:hypothetical protein [Gossypium davidsonii]